MEWDKHLPTWTETYIVDGGDKQFHRSYDMIGSQLDLDLIDKSRLTGHGQIIYKLLSLQM